MAARVRKAVYHVKFAENTLALNYYRRCLVYFRYERFTIKCILTVGLLVIFACRRFPHAAEA
jgi:hypothetical protein